MEKRAVLQSVFDSPAALRATRAGHKAACEALARTPRADLDIGNPNHPSYDMKLFGYDVDVFLKKQHR
jgi:hypothetical protein